MKKSIILLFSIVSVFCLKAQGVTYQKYDSITVVHLLQQARKSPAKTNKSLFFARKLLNMPYVASTLEVNDNEQLVINLRQLDCTTLVENVTALTICSNMHKSSFSDFCSVLKSLRYRNGRMIDYTSRLHYFTQWIVDNSHKGYVNEIQTPNPPFCAVQTIGIHYMSLHASSYRLLSLHPKFITAIKRYEDSINGHKFRFIPKSLIIKNDKSLRTVKDGDIIAITTSKDGLDIAHVGFAAWHRDGLHLLNASMIHHKVVEESMTLGNYLKKHPSHTGIRIVRIIK